MCKKIFLLCLLSISMFLWTSSVDAAASGCKFGGGDIMSSLNSCFGSSNVVNPAGDLKVESGFKVVILRWIKAIGSLLGILAVGSIVYGAFLMVISQGDEEKFKKAKQVVIWSLVGFLALVSASALIAVVVNVFYGIA